MIASMPVALLANPSLPARSVGDVIALSRQEGSRMAFGTGAVGTASYLCAEFLKVD